MSMPRMTFHSLRPSGPSWVYIACVVMVIHGLFIGSVLFFNHPSAVLNQKDVRRLTVQTIDLSPSASENQMVAMSASQLQPNPIPKNPLPSAPLDRNVLEKKSIPAKEQRPNTPQKTYPTSPSQLHKNPVISPSTVAKQPPKSAIPSKPKKTNTADAKLPKLSIAGNKTDQTAAELKKKQEMVAARKKKESEELAETERQEKLIAMAKERMSKINASRDLAASKSPNPLPSTVLQTITSLEVDAIPVSKRGAPLSPGEATYRDELAGRLKLQLRLPEYGDVKVNLTIDRTGKVVKVAIGGAESSANRRYIEKTLPALSFPAFGPNFESAEEYTFSITLSNEPFAKLHLWPNSPLGAGFGFLANHLWPIRYVDLRETEPMPKSSHLACKASFAKGSNEF